MGKTENVSILPPAKIRPTTQNLLPTQTEALLDVHFLSPVPFLIFLFFLFQPNPIYI
jgi:hypothetical protein